MHHEGPESEKETLPHLPQPNVIEVIKIMDLQHLPQSQESLPDSEFAVNCRCGVTGNGNIVFHQKDGEVIQCDDCQEWSHIGCQQNGRASNLSPKDTFHCDKCDPEAMWHLLAKKCTVIHQLMVHHHPMIHFCNINNFLKTSYFFVKQIFLKTCIYYLHTQSFKRI